MTYDYLIGSGFHRWTQGTYTPGQVNFMADTRSPSILYTGAYRAGKTEIASRGAIRHCLAFPRAKFGVFRAKLKSLKQSTLRTVLELVHPSWVVSWSNVDLELRFFNGSTLTFLGCDFADRIGSIELSGGFIDEAHEVSQESYGMIVGRMSAPLEVDEDNLALFPEFRQYAEHAVDNRQLFLACNPKSRGHWLYQDFIDPNTRLPGRKVYSSNTITNKNLPESYLRQNLNQYARGGITEQDLAEDIAAIRSGQAPEDGMHLVSKLTPFGQRNLLGLWVALEGAILDIDRDRLEVKQEPESWGTPLRWYAAADFGYHHPRLILASYHKGNKLVLRDFWSAEKVDQQPLLEKLKAWDAFLPSGLDSVFLPPDQPGIVDQARKVLGASKVSRANNKVLAGIGSLQVAINRGQLKVNAPDSPRDSLELFWAEMEGYSWKRDREGNWLDEPLKENDHYPDCLRYMVHTLVSHKKLSLQTTEKPPELGWEGLGSGLKSSGFLTTDFEY